jgi:hypothetical protein
MRRAVNQVFILPFKLQKVDIHYCGWFGGSRPVVGILVNPDPEL